MQTFTRRKKHRIPWWILPILGLFCIPGPVVGEEQHACRFLGVIGSEIPSGTVDKMLEGLQKLGDVRNPDGWGIVFFPTDTPKSHIKRPTEYRGEDQASGSSDYDYAQRKAQVLPKALVGHIRRASSGCPDIPNPHPFIKRKSVFAHNGDVDEDILLNLLSTSCLLSPDISPDYESLSGEDLYIDSDLYFIDILQNIGDSVDPCCVTLQIRRAIWDLVRELNDRQRSKRLNMVYTDGEILWAIRYASVHTDYYTVYYCVPDPEEKWRAVSSAPLEGFSWTLLENYRMIRFRPGEAPLIYDLTQDPYKMDCHGESMDTLQDGPEDQDTSPAPAAG